MDLGLAGKVAIITGGSEGIGRVNNAGRSATGEFEKLTDADWQDDLDLKLFGAI